MRRWRNALIVAGLAVLIIAVGCRLVPERYAVNAPVAHMLFGLQPAKGSNLASLSVPEGFVAGVYAAGINDARMLRFTPKGDLIVSTPRSGSVKILLADGDGDGQADGVRTLIDGLNNPHGVELFEGAVFIAEEDAIGRIAFDAERGVVTGSYQRIVTGLPSDGGHSSRTVRAGPDRKLYVTAGSSCNACIERDRRRAAMLRFDLDGKNGEIFAEGLRNSVGFDWRPADGAIYATDNGRDLLGDDTPPCELNRIVQGRHYGWPYAYGNNIPDPDFGPLTPDKLGNNAALTPPVHGFRAHNAPLGITFVRHPRAPAMLRGAALVALHGSWNRSIKDGYKVVSLHWLADGRIEERDFLWGFLDKNEDPGGRPVDVAEGPDGAIYVSSDYGGAIYRISRTGGN